MGKFFSPIIYNRFSLIIAVILFGLTLGLWQYFSVPVHDDFCYLRQVQDTCYDDFWDGYGDPIEGWQDAFKSAWNHYKLVNGRLTNILMILTVPMPDWVVAAILGIASSLMFFFLIYTVELETGKKLGTWFLWLVFLIIWKWFPFSDHMQSRDYFLNYLLPSFFILLYSFIFFRFIKSKNISPIFLAGGCVIAFIMGWLHEGFGLPCIAASILSLFFLRKPGKNVILVVSFLIAGGLLCIMTPSTINRLFIHDGPRFTASSDYSIFSAFLEMKFQLIIFFISIIFAIFLRKEKFKFFNVYNIYWGVLFAGCFAIAFVLHGKGRFFWLSELSLLVMTIYVCIKNFRIFRKSLYPLAFLFFCSSLAFSILLLKETYKIAESQKELISELRKSKEGIAYINLISYTEIPWYTLGMVQPFYTFGCELGLYTNDYHFDRAPLILPSSFKGKSFDKWDKLPGNNPFRGGKGYWYSDIDLKEGTRYKLKLGKLSLQAFPLRNYPMTFEGEIRDKMPVLTEFRDTLWIYNLGFPVFRLVESMDLIESK